MGRLGRKKKRALGARWEGEREKRVRLPPFLSSHRSQRAVFRLSLFSLGYPAAASSEERDTFPPFLLENGSGEREKFWGWGGGGGTRFSVIESIFNYFCSVLLIPMSKKKCLGLTFLRKFMTAFFIFLPFVS